MEKVNASRFKQQCLAIIENLKPEGILVTKHGKPLARVIPVHATVAHALLRAASTLVSTFGGVEYTLAKF